MKKDDFGDRMKMYERLSEPQLMPFLPVLARLDGRAFHSFCKDLEKPYDRRLRDLMIDCMLYMMRETQALCGYTQSDEISLVWYSPEPGSELFFGGRYSKMLSILPAMLSVYFNQQLPDFLPDHCAWMPLFDCRVWNVPTVIEAANAFLWREQDATKNSLQMAARCLFSHKELMGVKQPVLHEMLHSKGVNWNDYPASFKRGTFGQRTTPLATLENPTPRSLFKVVDMPPFNQVTNRVGVIFRGEVPETAGETSAEVPD